MKKMYIKFEKFQLPFFTSKLLLNITNKLNYYYPARSKIYILISFSQKLEVPCLIPRNGGHLKSSVATFPPRYSIKLTGQLLIHSSKTK